MSMAQRLECAFNAWRLDGFAGMPHDHHQGVEGDHGRIETREVWAWEQLDWLGPEKLRWPGRKNRRKPWRIAG